jgi:hypothetical protein
MTADPQQSVSITQRYTVPQGEEPGVVMSARDLDRLIERLDGCQPGGWGELWLAGVGAGIAVAAATAVGALTLPVTLTGLVAVLWAVTGAGTLITVLCLAGYLTQRRDPEREISELKKDLEKYKPRTSNKLTALDTVDCTVPEQFSDVLGSLIFSGRPTRQ